MKIRCCTFLHCRIENGLFEKGLDWVKMSQIVKMFMPVCTFLCRLLCILSPASSPESPRTAPSLQQHRPASQPSKVMQLKVGSLQKCKFSTVAQTCNSFPLTSNTTNTTTYHQNHFESPSLVLWNTPLLSRQCRPGFNTWAYLDKVIFMMMMIVMVTMMMVLVMV